MYHRGLAGARGLEGEAVYRVWHQPRLQGKAGGVVIVIQESLTAIRGSAPQLLCCEILFLRVGSRDHLGLLILYQSPCYCLSSWTARFVMEFPRIMVLGDFNLPSLKVGLEVAWEITETMSMACARSSKA